VVLAAPLTDRTRHLIDAQALAAIPPGAGVHLVNVARGGLVDQEALRPALDDGRVARATLDVTDPEPLPAGHWLYHHPRARISAHVSWSAPGAFELLLDTFVDNLRRFHAGEPLEGRVDLEAGY
jgi:phosphoglycerate dehydrogenase-like enzyme